MSDGNESVPARPELAAQLQVTGPGFHLGYGVLLIDSRDVRDAVRNECRAFFERLQKYSVEYRRGDE